VKVLKSRRLRWAGHVPKIWETKTLIQNFCEEASQKTEKRWESNIRTYLRKMVSLGVDIILLLMVMSSKSFDVF
jgi:hypothetical protein